VKASNLDMLWSFYDMEVMEKILVKLVQGVSCQSNQLYRELCVSALCSLRTGSDANFVCHDAEYYGRPEDICQGLYLKVFKTGRVKAVGVLLRFLEDLVQKRIVYKQVTSNPTMDENQKKLNLQSNGFTPGAPEKSTDHMAMQVARLLQSLISKSRPLMYMANCRVRVDDLLMKSDTPKEAVEFLALIR